jgi:hypothetical protein
MGLYLARAECPFTAAQDGLGVARQYSMEVYNTNARDARQEQPEPVQKIAFQAVQAVCTRRRESGRIQQIDELIFIPQWGKVRITGTREEASRRIALVLGHRPAIESWI